MKTFDPLQGNLFEDELTSSPEGSRAKTFQSPEKAPESMAGPEAVYGERCSDSLGKSDRLGCSLRTSLLSALGGGTECSGTWKRSATPAGRSWWVLAISERRTDATACGLWPTADTVMRKSARSMTASRENGRRSGGGNSSPPGLGQMAEIAEGIMPPEIPEDLPPKTREMIARMWPTATATDANSSGGRNESAKKPGSKTHPGTSLTDAANWGTPRVTTNGGAGTETDDPKSRLEDQVVSWTTPNARDVKDQYASPDYDERHVAGSAAKLTCLARLHDGRPGPASDNTNGNRPASSNWPSPTAQETGVSLDDLANPNLGSRIYRKDGSKQSVSVGLMVDIVENWPTPNAMDGQRGPNPGGLPGHTGGENLAMRSGRGILNSRWVLTLMGYPPDWCDAGIDEP